MKGSLRWICVSLGVVLLAGCSLPAPDASSDGSKPSEASTWFNPANTFKNPQAQALARAVQDNNVDEVRRLIKDEHINPDGLFSDDGHRIPLVAWPVITQSLGGLKALLDNGANPNARDPKTHQFCVADDCETKHDYDNAMVYAAKAEDAAYLQALLEHSGDPNTRNSNEESLLFQAFIWHNQWPNVQVLVEHGADINVVTQGEPILGDYTREGDFKKAYWLLQHGADPKALDPKIKALPGQVIHHLPVEDIFWYPSKPDFIDAQRQCQHWLRDHGIERPPLPKYYRDMRQRVGYPTEEKDIPLL